MSNMIKPRRSGGVIGTIGPIRGSGVFSLQERYALTADNYEDVSLYLKMNGANGSTTFYDSSLYGHTVTANGNAQVSTAQSKFGGASAAFDGTGDRLDLASNAAFDLESGSYAVEFFVWFTSRVLGTRTVVFEGASETVGIITTGTDTNNLLANLFGTGTSLVGTGALASKDGQWLHIALTSDGTNRRLFLDGVLLASTTNRCLPDGVCSIGVGGNTVRFAETNFNGYIDDLRITKGVARYTGNFTPPQREFRP